MTSHTFGPKFDCSQSISKTLLIWDQAQNGVCHSATIETAHTFGIQVLKETDIQKIELSRDKGLCQAGKEKVHLYALKFQLDNRHKGIRNRLHCKTS